MTNEFTASLVRYMEHRTGRQQMIGNRNTAQRIVNAENNFVELLMSIAGITEAEAVKVMTLYRKNKIAKLDAIGGRISVKHGAFLDADVIHNAVNA